MSGRWVRRWMDEVGFCASCRCGWRTRRNTRALRDQDADECQHVWTEPARTSVQTL
jgi:hypothetical protein